MPFPYSIKKKTDIKKPEVGRVNFGKELIKEILHKIFSDKGITDYHSEKNKIKFKTKQSLVGFEYDLKLEISEKNNVISVEYEFFLDKLLQITSVLVIFIALFSYFNVSTFLIFSGIFAVIFYGINIIFINSYIKNNIEKIYGNKNEFEQDEELDRKQKEWLKDVNNCPACGERVTEIDLFCPDCGLKVKQNRYSIPLDTSKYKNREVKYIYKKS